MSFANTEYCQVIISAPSREEASAFADKLVSSRLIAGSLIIEGASRYWWAGEIVEKTYWNVQAFTLIRNKDNIIKVIEAIAL